MHNEILTQIGCYGNPQNSKHQQRLPNSGVYFTLNISFTANSYVLDYKDTRTFAVI